MRATRTGADEKGDEMGSFESDDADDRAELAELIEQAAARGGGEAAGLVALRDSDYQAFMRSGGADRLLEIDRRRARR